MGETPVIAARRVKEINERESFRTSDLQTQGFDHFLMSRRELSLHAECKAEDTGRGNRFEEEGPTKRGGGGGEGREGIGMGSIEEEARIARGATNELGAGEERLGAMDSDSEEVGGTETQPRVGEVEGRGGSEDGFEKGSGDAINFCKEARGGGEGRTKGSSGGSSGGVEAEPLLKIGEELAKMDVHWETVCV